MCNHINFIGKRTGQKDVHFIGEKVGDYVVKVIVEGIGDPKYDFNGIDDVVEYFDDYKEVYIPLFNGSIMSQEVKNNLKNIKSINDILGTEFEKYLCKEGDNEGGLTIEKVADYGQQNEPSGIDIFEGKFGLRIMQKLPRKTWEKIRKCSTYWSEADADEYMDDNDIFDGDISDYSGWFYADEVVEILKGCGLKVRYRHIDMTDKKLEDVRANFAEQERLKKIQLEQTKKVVNETESLYKALWANREKMTVSDVKEVYETITKEILCPAIGINGHNIYGSGVYLSFDNNYLYFIENNGMDGDNWAESNCGSSGAGWIISRVVFDENAKKLIDNINILENTK